MNDDLRRLTEGGEAAVAELFSQRRDRLARMVRFRLVGRLHGRVDAEDILQDAYIEIARRIGDYLAAWLSTYCRSDPMGRRLPILRRFTPPRTPVYGSRIDGAGKMVFGYRLGGPVPARGV